MVYLAHTAHSQLVAFWLSCMGWTLTAVALGLIQWRIWLVTDREVISSGVAWVGIWRACFNTHNVVSPGFRVMHCRHISLTEAFTPPEIVAGQALMILSLTAGAFGNAGGVYSLRNVYLGLEKETPLRLSFFTTGALCLLAAVLSLIPLVWNLTSVVTNQTIAFPPEFKMPQAPHSQYAGPGIGVGMVGTILMIVSGIIFCRYRIPARPQRGIQPSHRERAHMDRSSHAQPDSRGENNPAFESHEHVISQ